MKLCVWCNQPSTHGYYIFDEHRSFVCYDCYTNTRWEDTE